MKLLTSFSITCIFLTNLFISFAALSAETEQAKLLLERFSQSLRQVNFNTSFVVVKNNQAEPYHWMHGIIEKPIKESHANEDTENDIVFDSNVKERIELEILALLNGPRRDILRINNMVSYIEPEYAPYSIKSKQISGPIPTVFSQDVSVLENNYHLVLVGKNRILGRAAQLVRIVPKDSHRFGYWLWLDQESSLLLKLAVITQQGNLLEQIQFTHLDITDSISENLSQLESSELPKVIDITFQQKEKDLVWQVNWLPNGFESVKSDRHRISKQTVESMLFNDGLVDISVYVSPSKEGQ